MIIFRNPKAFSVDHLQKGYGGHREALADMKRLSLAHGKNSVYEFFQGVDAYRKMGAIDKETFDKMREGPFQPDGGYRLLGELMPQQVALLYEHHPDALKDPNELRKILKEHGRYTGA